MTATGSGARTTAPARFLALVLGLLVVAACSSSHSLACQTQAACPSLDGVTAFCSFPEWGCAREAACGGYVGVVDVTVDAKLTYFYSAETGAYVATVREAFGGGDASCANGPGTFTPPTSCTFLTLAACAPVARDGGVVPVDAGPGVFDSGSTGPAPSGQPLVQPPK